MEIQKYSQSTNVYYIPPLKQIKDTHYIITLYAEGVGFPLKVNI